MSIAQKELSKGITLLHVHKGHVSAKNIKKSYLLNKLTEHHKLLYNLIKEKREIMSGELWKQYLRKCHNLNRRAIALRTYSEYINKLIEIGLVQSDRALVRGKVRVFKIGNLF